LQDAEADDHLDADDDDGNHDYEFNGSFVSYVFSLIKTDDFSVTRPVDL